MDIQVPDFFGAAKPEVSKNIAFVQVGSWAVHSVDIASADTTVSAVLGAQVLLTAATHSVPTS